MRPTYTVKRIKNYTLSCNSAIIKSKSHDGIKKKKNIYIQKRLWVIPTIRVPRQIFFPGFACTSYLMMEPYARAIENVCALMCVK